MSKGLKTFNAQIGEAVAAFPTLAAMVVNGKRILKGYVSVIDKDGKHWEDYYIEIHPTKNYPNEFPWLYETGGKIPKIADWHVYEDSLSCCVKVRPEELMRCKKGITIKEYIAEEVMPYLFNQTHRRMEGYYAGGEYAHGIMGVYEYYATVLGTGNDVKETVRLMQFIVSHDRPKKTAMCFCNGGAKFRHCHRTAFDILKLMGKDLESHAYILQKLLG